MEINSESRLKRFNFKIHHFGWIVPLIIGGVVYFTTFCRTVYIGDSGEFSLVFSSLGIAHPPGYPLFTLMGRVFLIFSGFFKPAFSANLLNVVIALSVVPVLFTVFRGRNNPLIAGIVALIWMFSPLFWSETVGVEVYALSLLFIALISALTLNDSPQKWFLIAYIFGLACAHHPTIIALIPPAAIIFILGKDARKYKRVHYYVLLFLLGLSIYIYLPVRSALSPVADWGSPVNIQRLFSHITGSQYHHAASFSLVHLLESCRLFISVLFHNWWWIGVVCLLVGVVIGLKYYLKRTLFCLVLLVSNIILVSFYHIPDIDPYYLPGLLACLILMGDLLIWLWGRYSNRTARYALVSGGAIMALWLATANYHALDRSDYNLAEDYGKLILDTAEEGTVFTGEDIGSFPALYLRCAEGYRPQVEIFDKATRLSALFSRAERLSGKTVADYQSAREIYFQCAPGIKHLVKSHHLYTDEWLNVPSRLHSNGIIYSTAPPPKRVPIPSFSADYEALDFKSRQLLTNMELCRGEEYLLKSPPDSTGALQSFQDALRIMETEPRGALHNQLGIFFRHFGYANLALTSYERGLESTRLSEVESREIIFNISNIYKDMGNRLIAAEDYHGAVEAYSKALKYDPHNPKLYFNVGFILVEYLKAPEKGLPYLEVYLKYHPDDVRVRNMISAYRKR